MENNDAAEWIQMAKIILWARDGGMFVGKSVLKDKRIEMYENDQG